jgi:hypothetical protein
VANRRPGARCDETIGIHPNGPNPSVTDLLQWKSMETHAKPWEIPKFKGRKLGGKNCVSALHERRCDPNDH